ncbi:lysophospholipid acyltransferase family protein [Desulfococcaceae bacterium HSG9]|nr:lysophospholipid acyltransferase family protein [Desulfococcaceae bacterium HSG9]
MFSTYLIYAWVIFVTAIFSVAVFLASLTDSKGVNPHKVAGIWARCILFGSRVKVRIRGLSNIDHSRSYIFMLNHQSLYDIPVILGCLPVQFRWLAKHELFKIPLFGTAMRRAGYISINRTNRRSAFKSLKIAALIIRSGVPVVIFPEGTRSPDGRILPFKKGGFVLAIQSQVPIVPVIIQGTSAILTKKQIKITPGEVSIQVCAPIPTTDYTIKTKEILMDRVKTVISEPFENLK